MTELATPLPQRRREPTEREPALAGSASPGPGRWLVTVVATIGGLVLGALMLTHLVATLIMPLRFLLAVVGLAIATTGFRRIIRWARGPEADALLWFCSIYLGLLALGSVCAMYLPLPEGMNPSLTLMEPGRATPDLLSAHPLGTDTAGLDLLTQALTGARVTLVVAGGATVLAMLVGGALGLVAGYGRGRIDAVIAFLTDSLLAFPPLILLMAMVTILRPNALNLTLALAFIVTPNFIRLSRASTIKIASREFVMASKALGATSSRTALRVVLPNVVPSLVSYGCVMVGILAVAEGSLSFLGLGIQRPLPTWGNMIAQGQPHLETSPHMVVVPALALFLTVLSINYIGQKLQGRWNA